jgi:hypothetical protein
MHSVRLSVRLKGHAQRGLKGLKGLKGHAQRRQLGPVGAERTGNAPSTLPSIT